MVCALTVIAAIRSHRVDKAIAKCWVVPPSYKLRMREREDYRAALVNTSPTTTTICPNVIAIFFDGSRNGSPKEARNPKNFRPTNEKSRYPIVCEIKIVFERLRDTNYFFLGRNRLSADPSAFRLIHRLPRSIPGPDNHNVSISRRNPSLFAINYDRPDDKYVCFAALSYVYCALSPSSSQRRAARRPPSS